MTTAPTWRSSYVADPAEHHLVVAEAWAAQHPNTPAVIVRRACEGRVERVSPGMSIGASIFLIAVGLILALAVNVDLSGIDVQTIGWILTLVGVGGLVLSLTMWNRRRVAVREEAVVRDQPVVRDTPVVREERVIREDPPSY
jgi:ABC-type transport system involved in cytochrome c biogenesis permease subunit